MAKISHPTAEELRSLLDYDPSSGVLIWRARFTGMMLRGKPIPHAVRFGNWNIQHAGAVAGGVGNHGYIAVGICGARYLAHRIAWAIHHGKWPEEQIDHINGNRADNRMSNLRAVNNLDNCHNKRLSKANKSGVNGVGWHSRDEKWAAFIMVAGQQKSLGYFDDISAAIATRKAAERAANFHENHGRK